MPSMLIFTSELQHNNTGMPQLCLSTGVESNNT